MSIAAMTADERVSVLIIGGGYAGVIAANRLLASMTPVERAHTHVAIVNPTDRFVHRIRLHEHAAGNADSGIELASMIHPEVAVVLGRAERIDPHARLVRVTTSDGPVALEFDWLIYAVGSRSSSVVRGASRFALSIGDIDGATEVARRLAVARTPSVCVVGGGPAGVETAAEISEAHPRAKVTLIAGSQLVPAMRPAARRSIRRRLRRLNVDVKEGEAVSEVTAAGVITVAGVRLQYDLVIWSAGFEVPDLASRSGLPVDGEGRLCVDDTLFCADHSTILGAGDAVKLPDSVGRHLPMGARTALPLGGAAADSLLARLRGSQPEPVSIGLLGPSISIGRHDGYIQLARRDDSPTLIAFTGVVGAAIKAWVCRMTIDRTRDERVSPGAYRVPPGPRRHGIDAAKSR